MAYEVTPYDGLELCCCGQIAKYKTKSGRYVCGTNPVNVQIQKFQESVQL